MEARAPVSGARVVAVSGGRGAAGKSVVAANLAWTLAQTGRRVAVVDLDPEAPSQHVLLGTVGGRPGLGPLLNEANAPDAALSETRHPNLHLVIGANGGVPLSAGARLRHRLRALKVDVVVLDVGVAGDWAASGLFELGDQRIAVATPQGASVHDAYGLFKSAVLRAVRGHLERASQLGVYDSAQGLNDGDKIGDLVERVRGRDPALAEEIGDTLDSFGGYLVGTEVQDGAQLGVFQALANMAYDYLGIQVPLLGWLKLNARLPDLGAIRGSLGSGNNDEARAFRQMAETVAAALPPIPEEVPIEVDMSEDSEGPGRPRPRTTPPPIPLPRPVPAPRAPEPKPASTIKPRVHVPTPRRRRTPDAKPDLRDDGRPRRKKTLPGMPPARVNK